MILRLFDIAAGEVVHSYDGAHDDYIRCVKGLENTHLLSGGYDGKVKLFDFRVHSSPQLIFHHATQV
jgi:WD40 repeat protein